MLKKLALTALLCTTPMAAHPTVLRYSVTGPVNAIFSIDSSLARCGTTSVSFTYCGRQVTIGGLSINGRIVFGADPFAGFTIFDNSNQNIRYSFDSSQLFTGTPAAPTLLTGTFNLQATNLTSGGVYVNALPRGTSYILNVLSVPEPATWAMMIAGFGLVGGAMRRRRVRVAFAAA